VIKKPVLVLGILLTITPFLTSCPKNLQNKREDKIRKEFAIYIASLRSGEKELEALARLDELLLKYPQNSLADDALLEIGRFHLNRGENEKAIEYFKSAISHQESASAEAKYNLGLALFKLGKLKEALTVLGEITTRDPYYKEASIIIVDAFLAEGKILDALNRWLKIRKTIDDEKLLAPRDQALREAMEKLKSEELKAIATDHSGTIAGAHATYLLALRAFDEGEFAQSREVLTRFLAYYPEDADSNDARKLLEEIKGISQINPRAIGVILPLSGRLAQHGKRFLKGIALATQIFNPSLEQAFSVELHLIDSKDDPDIARRGVEELATKHKVIAIIGPAQGDTALAAGKEADALGVPIITLTQLEEVTEIGPMVFRNFITPRDQANTLASYATTALRCYKFAILYPDHEYGKKFADAFQEEVIKSGGEVVISQAYPPQQVDFREEISKIRKVRQNIDAIFIPDSYRVVANVAPQLIYHGVTHIQLLGSHEWNSPRLIEFTRHQPSSIEGAVFTDAFFAQSRAQAVREFTEEFYTTFEESPDIFEAIAYETAEVVLSILKEKRVLTRESLQNELANLKNHPSFSGYLHISPDRSFKRPLFILQVMDGQITDIPTTGSF